MPESTWIKPPHGGGVWQFPDCLRVSESSFHLGMSFPNWNIPKPLLWDLLKLNPTTVGIDYSGLQHRYRLFQTAWECLYQASCTCCRFQTLPAWLRVSKSSIHVRVSFSNCAVSSLLPWDHLKTLLLCVSRIFCILVGAQTFTDCLRAPESSLYLEILPNCFATDG